MSPALSLAQVSEVDCLREEAARLRAALTQAADMAEAGQPRVDGKVPRLVVSFTLSSISAVCQAALEES